MVGWSRFGARITRVHGIKVAARARSLSVGTMQDAGWRPAMPEQQPGKSDPDTAATRSGDKEPQGNSPQDVEEGVTSKDATGIDPQDPIDPKSPKLVTP